MSKQSDFKLALIGMVGATLIRLLGLTWRVRWVNRHFRDDARRGRGTFIYVIWHGEMLPLLYAHRSQNVSAMISEHRDGEIIARVVQRLGFRTIRGSTTRGAARALLSACREIEEGHTVVVTLDGPRGPAHSVAPGAMVISQRTGAPMLPVVGTASRAWHLRSWDRFTIPKPFARVTIAYGRPFAVNASTARDAANEADETRLAMESLAEQLTR
jgi:hypothetical protein